jgi:hypothetical protein
MVPHTLRLRADDDGYAPTWSIGCPHIHVVDDTATAPYPVPDCEAWTTTPAANQCICDCDDCLDGNHDDCQTDYVEDVGNKWCQARPTGECFYSHAIREVGTDIMRLVGDFDAEWKVTLTGNGWEEPIEITEVTDG